MNKTSTLSLITLGICSVFSLSANAQLINEGFENAFPPTGWTIDNPDALKTFEQASIGKTGSKSAFVDVFNMDANGAEQGQKDALITSAVNLSSVTSPTLTFQRAYQMYSDPATYTPKDELNVYISTDGGTTWTSIFNKIGTALITATTQFNASAGFVPTSSEWALETVSLSASATATSAQFKFEFLNDWENNFYLDDIMVTGGGAGINDLNIDDYISVYPNPSSGAVNVYGLSNLGQADVKISNILGEVISETSENFSVQRKFKCDLSAQPNGIYFVEVKTANASAVKKIVISK